MDLICMTLKGLGVETRLCPKSGEHHEEISCEKGISRQAWEKIKEEAEETYKRPFVVLPEISSCGYKMKEFPTCKIGARFTDADAINSCLNSLSYLHRLGINESVSVNRVGWFTYEIAGSSADTPAADETK